MNKRGITLMELIIVMAIIAVGAVLMVPNIAAWLPNYRLRSATRDIVSSMRVAQMKAVSRNEDHRVSFDPGNGSYFIMRRTTAGIDNWVRIGLSDQPAIGADDAKEFLPTGIQFDAINFGGNNVEFNPNSSASGGNVILKNSKGTQKTIRVLSTTGRVRIE